MAPRVVLLPRRRQQAGTFAPLRTAPAALTENDRKVLRLLEMPPLRIWTREALIEATGLQDRTVRQCIANLEAARKPVMSSSGRGGGYWLASSAEELEEWRGELLSRMRAIGSKVQAVEEVQRMLRARAQEGKPARQVALL